MSEHEHARDPSGQSPCSEHDFITALFEPLPKTEEQPDDISYRRQLRNDMRRIWWTRWSHWQVAHHLQQATSYRAAFARVDFGQDSAVARQATRLDERAKDKLAIEADALLMTPAPTKSDLQLKKRLLRGSPSNTSWAASVKADETRLMSGRAKA